MPPLFDALKKAATGRKSAAQLGDELEALRATEAELLLRYDALALAAADGEASQADADKAHAELTRHRVAIERLENVLAAIVRREEKTAAENAAADLDAAWSNAVAASKSREAVADRVQNLVRQLGDAFRELSSGTIETFRAVPNTYPTHARDAFAVEVGMCGALLATEYSRNGLPGGPNLLGIVPQTLADRLRQATVALEQARAKARNPEAAAHG